MQANCNQDSIKDFPEHFHSLTQKSEWNAAQPISRLPPETLLHIFKLVKLIWKLTPILSMQRTRWDWLVLTQVCRHWRDVALNCPNLWVEIVEFRDISKVETFLERSKNADIKFSFKEECSVQLLSSFIESLHPHMQRVLSLSLYFRNSVEWHNIQGLLENLGSHPRLKHLYLKSYYTSSSSSLLFDEDIASSLNVHLYELVLDCISLPWNHQAYQNLCELRLTDIYSHSPTLSEIFEILESCPNLHALDLHNAGPRSLSNVTHRPIHLNKMEKIRIAKIEFTVCAEFLNTIVIPPKAECFIDCTNYPFRHPTPISPTFLARRTQHKELTIELVDNGVLFHWGPYGWSRSCFRIAPTMIALEWKDSPDLERMIMDVFSSFRTIFKQSCWNDVEFVSFNSDLNHRNHQHAMKRVVWSCLFDSLPMLKKLDVSFPKSYPEMTTDIISALMEPVDVNAPYSFKYAELEEIMFTSATFSTPEGRESNKLLLKHLKDRTDTGKRLKRLNLRYCSGIGRKKKDNIRGRNIADVVSFSSNIQSDDDAYDDSDDSDYSD